MRPQDDGCARWAARGGRRPRSGRGERHMVHGVPSRLLVDRTANLGGKEKPKEPRHERGIVPDEPGLYFVGLFFLYALSSSLLTGVGRGGVHR